MASSSRRLESSFPVFSNSHPVEFPHLSLLDDRVYLASASVFDADVKRKLAGSISPERLKVRKENISQNPGSLASNEAPSSDAAVLQMLQRAIVEDPNAAARMAPALRDRDWTPADAASILKLLALHYTPALGEVAQVCISRMPRLNKNDVNQIMQIIGVSSPNMATRKFHVDLFDWLIQSGNYPAPFAWTQAIGKLIDHGKETMIKPLWKFANRAAAPFPKFSLEWRQIMFAELSAKSEFYETYMKLLPFFITYDFNADRLGDVDEPLRYIDRDLAAPWLQAFEVALAEKKQRISYLLTAPFMIDQINDKGQTRIEGVRLAVRYGKYDLVEELLTRKAVSDLSMIQLKALYIELVDLRDPAIISARQLISAVLRKKETEEL